MSATGSDINPSNMPQRNEISRKLQFLPYPVSHSNCLKQRDGSLRAHFSLDIIVSFAFDDKPMRDVPAMPNS